METPVMSLEEWYEAFLQKHNMHYSLDSFTWLAAREAWEYQQRRIEALEEDLDDLENSLELCYEDLLNEY